MLRFIIRRILLMIPTLLGITLIVQLFIVITPGDPARTLAGPQAEEWEYEALREQMGLDDPFFVRYVNFITKIMQGDSGTSFYTKRPVMDEIAQRFPYSLMLVVISLILSIIIGIPLGIYAATHQYSWKDNAAIFGSLVCVSMPSFWFALLLIQLLCVKYRILPTSGIEHWSGWILPSVTAALSHAASIARQTRSNLLEVIRQDFISTARAKGLSERVVLYRHALKNAVIPVIMVVGGIFGMALGGSMISEVVFSIPGLGAYTLSALQRRDYPVIQTSVLFMSAMFAVVLLLIDIAFALVDPRIRSQYAAKKTKKVERRPINA